MPTYNTYGIVVVCVFLSSLGCDYNGVRLNSQICCLVKLLRFVGVKIYLRTSGSRAVGN